MRTRPMAARVLRVRDGTAVCAHHHERREVCRCDGGWHGATIADVPNVASDVEVARGTEVCCLHLTALLGDRTTLVPAIPALRAALARHSADAALESYCEEVFRMCGSVGAK
jgi:hypothetical protein